ncbi:MAG: hypothetical protein CMH60_03585 [Myxococcales bacterium]|nr:hypothetical protein [Myxococcales bacterium]
MRYLIACIFLFWASGCQQQAKQETTKQQPPVQTRSVVDKATLTTGETLTFALEADHLPGIELEIPEIGTKIIGLRIVDMGQDPKKERAGRTYLRHWYKMRADLVGSYILPSVELTYQHEGEAKKLETSEIFIEVQSVLPADGSAQDIRGLKKIKRPKTKPPWKWITLATFVLLAIFFVLWRRRKSKNVIELPPIIPAHEIAYRALNQLRQTNFEDSEAVRRYFFTISEIVRLYVENRFGLNATDLTLEEIKHALRERNLLSQEQRNSLETFLERTDRIKFAKSAIQEKDIEELYEGALSFVESTQETTKEAA